MIDSIEVIIKSGCNKESILIVYPMNICYINNKKYKVSNEFLDNIRRTISLFKNEYGTDKNIDSEEFFIIVKSKDREETFHGKGIFPDNYSYLKKLLGDLNA